MTTSNEHNNAPAVPQGEQKLPHQRWVDGDEHYPRSEALYKFISDMDFNHCGDSFCFKKGGDGDNGETLMYILDCWFAATPAPAPAPAQEIDKSVADAEIKSMYVESQGSDKGWLGIEGSYFIGGVVAARKQKAAPAPAQDEPLGHFRAEPFGWTDCAKDDEGEIALYERPQEVGLTDDEITQVCSGIYLSDYPHGSTSYDIALARAIIAALRAKGGKHV